MRHHQKTTVAPHTSPPPIVFTPTTMFLATIEANCISGIDTIAIIIVVASSWSTQRCCYPLLLIRCHRRRRRPDTFEWEN